MSATADVDEVTKPAPALSLPPRLHNALSYGGATLVFLVLASHDSTATRLVVGLWCLHFLRRTLESLFVHRYSGRPVPPADYVVEYVYYWGFAAWIAHGISAASWQLPGTLWTVSGILVFVCGEAGNMWSHQVLRRLRTAPGQTQRSIPRGGMFELVSCPHYLFEILSWCGFALLTQVWGTLAFLCLGAGIVSSYALARHKAYRAEFDGKDGRAMYEEKRKAIVPFLL